MWKNQKVSVILPTYNEKDSIRAVINAFFDTGYVDEVIAVNNNAAAGTSEEILQTRAIQIIETKQGYGYALQAGLCAATGELLVLCEPDGTFEAADILKLLVYSDDFDCVWGTRTNVALISHGANMEWYMRFGNVLVAKLLQNLFNTSRLTDVGCTYKLMKRHVHSSIKDKFTIGSSHFGPELMLLTIVHGFSLVEIPLSYHERVGVSMVTGSMMKTFNLALRMILLIITVFFTSLGSRSKRPVFSKKI